MKVRSLNLAGGRGTCIGVGSGIPIDLAVNENLHQIRIRILGESNTNHISSKWSGTGDKTLQNMVNWRTQ